jgi:hypothetical protein
MSFSHTCWATYEHILIFVNQVFNAFEFFDVNRVPFVVVFLWN